MLAHEVVRARGTTRRQITGAVRRGTSRPDIIAENAQEFALYAMNVAVQGAFSQPFGDCVAAEVEMLAQYYPTLRSARLSSSAATPASSSCSMPTRAPRACATFPTTR
jgi:hypothetical protein